MTKLQRGRKTKETSEDKALRREQKVVPFKLRSLSSLRDCRAAMTSIINRMTMGEIGVDSGRRIVLAIQSVTKVHIAEAHLRLEERRLDKLGAAVESGRAIFQGINIIPPASRYWPEEEEDLADEDGDGSPRCDDSGLPPQAPGRH